jgi:superfamily II DNA or RNA helicase
LSAYPREQSLSGHSIREQSSSTHPPREQSQTRSHKRPLSLSFRINSEEIARQKWHHLKNIDLHSHLHTLLGPTAEFRGIQLPVLTSISQGHSPILAVMKTGGGKSLLFMLPASFKYSGTTIVIVPLLSLRQDFQRRCGLSHISCKAWDPEHPPVGVKVVLVTPESFVTAKFWAFLNGLRTTHQLDRIVLDECHILLDSSSSYRPSILQLKKLALVEARLVFLTATLPPSRLAEFWQLLNLPNAIVHEFRMATTRTNLQYSIIQLDLNRLDRGDRQNRVDRHERHDRQNRGDRHDSDNESDDSIDRDIVAALAAVVNRYHHQVQQNGGKTIVYARGVGTVEDLAMELGCATYHAHSEDREGTLNRFISGEFSIITATSALGLGIDIPDIRLVMHVQTPWTLLDYAQESGRAGRDGLVSKVVIIQDGREVEDLPLRRFMGRECRRVILDEYFDGRVDRIGCEEGEEICDICQELHGGEVSGGGLWEGFAVAGQELLEQLSGQSAGHSLGQSAGHSLGHSAGQSPGHSPGQSSPVELSGQSPGELSEQSSPGFDLAPGFVLPEHSPEHSSGQSSPGLISQFASPVATTNVSTRAAPAFVSTVESSRAESSMAASRAASQREPAQMTAFPFPSAQAQRDSFPFPSAQVQREPAHRAQAQRAQAQRSAAL